MIPSAAQNIIKAAEGLKLTAYLCPARVPTIGWGHTRTVTRADVGKKTITQAEAQRLFDFDVAVFEKTVDAMVKVKLTDNQRGALVSLAYNIGSGALAGSTLMRKLNTGDYKGAAQEFAKWDKAKGVALAGLTKWRAAEAKLFNTP